ncbi:AGAP002594-PA-like protein [Anopheles sinensis]|uniref:AGAP002594-PA-like protein n=1 Tax=Anopheles sinensis TaxID=74873 RepID=A0A084VS79_ANOSI|nr:AGAP002594-PA-like protein [Anopheles sinensis]
MISFPKFLLLMVSWWCAVDSGLCVIYTDKYLTLDRPFNFNETKFAGTWYEVLRLHDPSDPKQEDCVAMNFRPAENGSFDILKTYQITQQGARMYVDIKAEPVEFKYPKVPKFFERITTSQSDEPYSHMEVLAVDYSSYAILYYIKSINATIYTGTGWQATQPLSISYMYSYCISVLETARVLSRRTNLKKEDPDVVNMFLNLIFRRTEHQWRDTQHSADFCKPSSINATDVSTLSAVEVTDTKTFWLVDVSYRTNSHATH